MNQCHASFFPTQAGALWMGLCPDSYHRLLWHAGAGSVNRPPRQQLSKGKKGRRIKKEYCPILQGCCAEAGDQGEGMWNSRHRTADGAKTGRIGKVGGIWWNLPICWPSGDFLSEYLFFAGVVEGKGTLSLQGKTLWLSNFSFSHGAVLDGSGSYVRSFIPGPECLCWLPSTFWWFMSCSFYVSRAIYKLSSHLLEHYSWNLEFPHL